MTDQKPGLFADDTERTVRSLAMKGYDVIQISRMTGVNKSVIKKITAPTTHKKKPVGSK